jgi:hypothetical protein
MLAMRNKEWAVRLMSASDCRAYFRFNRIEIERACAERPSASASASAAGASFDNASASQASIVVRLRKSSTESPDENRAVREVGSTWFGPAM